MEQGFSRAAVEALSAYKEEPSWMTQLRLSAWEAYEKLSWPDNTAELPQEGIRPFTEPPAEAIPSREWPPDLPHALEERGDEEGLIVQRDSTVLSRSITKEQRKRGVIFTDLDTALKDVPELIRPAFARLVRPETKWAALHTAFWSGGSFLYVPDHVEIPLPFHACYWMSAPSAGLFPHTLIAAGKGSAVSFMDEYMSAAWPEPALSVEAAEIFAADGAQVRYLRIKNWGRSVRSIDHLETRTEGGGRVFSSQLRGSRPPLTLERVAELHPEVRV